MRILHLTPELPHQAGGGGRTREYLLCRRLAEQGHEVLNVSPALPDDRPNAEPLRAAGVENWIAPRPGSPAAEVARAVAAEPSVLAAAVTRPVRALEMRVFWTRLRVLAARAVAERRPDVAVIGHDMAAAWALDLPHELPVVLTCHNLTWRWYESRARHAGPLHAAALRAEGIRYRRHVSRLLPRFAAAVAVSTIEAEELRRIGGTRVELIPTGVDTRELRPAPEEPGPPRVLFTGTMSYPPNHQGIRWFVRDVWPLIRAELPDAQLDVVGKDPPPQVCALGGVDGVAVRGFVPSMAPYFARAQVAVVPIRSGAGIRVKIVEAMAAGRAIVSTPLGFEGLPGLEPGRHLLVEEEPGPFARATVRLLADGECRRRMATDARALAEAEYDWRGLGDQLERVLAAAARR